MLFILNGLVTSVMQSTVREELEMISELLKRRFT